MSAASLDRANAIARMSDAAALKATAALATPKPHAAAPAAVNIAPDTLERICAAGRASSGQQQPAAPADDVSETLALVRAAGIAGYAPAAAEALAPSVSPPDDGDDVLALTRAAGISGYSGSARP